MTSSQASFLPRSFRCLKTGWLNLFRPISLRRLGNSIETFEPELDFLIAEQTKKQANAVDVSWGAKSKQLLEAAKTALANCDAELGWRCLKAADRFTFYGMETGELRNEAELIQAEARDDEKAASKWRRKAIANLLIDEGSGKLKIDLTARSVVRAKRILDEQQDNVYHKHAILRSRLRLLSLISAIALAVWLVWSPLSPPISSALKTTEPAADILSARMRWVAVVMMALLGAIVSGFSSSISRDQTKTRIPAEISASTITFARISLAMVSAIVISIFLLSGILKFGTPSLELFLVAAFVSGFSDRLLLRAIDSFSK